MKEEYSNTEIINYLKSDDIHRNGYLIKLLRLINNNGTNRVFSLNGNWGSGKTVFIKKFNCLVNYSYLYDKNNNLRWDNIYSKKNTFSENDLKELRDIIVKPNYEEFDLLVKENNINSVYINAWEHDDEVDPIKSIMYELIKSYDLEKYDEKINASLKKFSDILIRLSTKGFVNRDDIISDLEFYKEIELKEELKKSISNILDDLICEKCQKLIIVIDELDRCNPIYAVKLLERIKHYLNDESIVVLLVTNIKELSNTISTIYGSSFSSEEYLDKIIDMRLELPKINTTEYIKTIDSIINAQSDSWLPSVEESFINYNNMELRPINRYISCMRFFEDGITSIDLIHYDYIDALVNCLFVPYIVGLFCTKIKKYNEFIDGNGWNDFEKFVANDKILVSLCESSLYRNKEVKDEDIFLELKKLYSKIFQKKNDKFEIIKIGDYEFYSKSLKNIHNKISLLGDLTDFSKEN
jgi:KaiC/GvpD/RAD55 family RecA-like ATPase